MPNRRPDGGAFKHLDYSGRLNRPLALGKAADNWGDFPLALSTHGNIYYPS